MIYKNNLSLWNWPIKVMALNEALPENSQKLHFNSSLCMPAIVSPLKTKRITDFKVLLAF